MIRRILTPIVSAVLLFATLTACGAARSEPPVQPGAASAPTGAPAANADTPGGVPLYPDAKTLESSSPLATVVDTMKQQLAQQQNPGADVKIDAYTLPSGTTFDQVKKFYGDSLGGDGWKEASTTEQTNLGIPGGGSATWLKDNNSVVTIMVMPDPTQSGNSVLLVSHAAAK